MTNHCQIGSSSNNNQPSSSSIFLTVLSHTILSHHPITCNAIFSAKAFIHGGMRLEIHFTHLRHSPLTPPPSSFCLAASACPHHVPQATTMYPPDALPASSYPHDVPAALADSLLHIRAPITVLTVGCTILILYFLALEFSFVIPSTPPPAPSFKVHPRDVLIVHLRHLSVWTFHKVVCHIFIRDAFLHFLLQPACWMLSSSKSSSVEVFNCNLFQRKFLGDSVLHILGLDCILQHYPWTSSGCFLTMEPWLDLMVRKYGAIILWGRKMLWLFAHVCSHTMMMMMIQCSSNIAIQCKTSGLKWSHVDPPAPLTVTFLGAENTQQNKAGTQYKRSTSQGCKMRFFSFLHNGTSSVELLLVKHDNWSMFEQKNFDKKKWMLSKIIALCPTEKVA